MGVAWRCDRCAYRAVCIFKCGQVGDEASVEEFGWSSLLAGCVGHVPVLFMLGVQQHDRTGGLGMEGGRCVKEGVFD